MKILLVDDNSDDRMLLRCIVERGGHEGIEATNGQEGLEQAAACLPDLIISDALMPIMDGFQFLRKIKQDATLSAIPFVFYSATYTGEEEVSLALSLGAEAYIIKPEDPARILSEVEGIAARGKKARPAPSLATEESAFLQRYSEIVGAKLEEKVMELEKALAEKTEAERALSLAKEEWEKTFDAMADVITLQDGGMRILRINKAGCDLFGHKAEELVGQRCYELFAARSEPCPDCPVVMTQGDRMPHQGEIMHEKLGKTFLVSAAPILDAQGAMQSIVHSSKDISGEKTLERQLRQTQNLEALGTLAGGIAHDFNNILNAILGYGEMVLQALPADSQAWHDQQEVLKAVQRATDLVRQILTFSRKTEQECRPLQVHFIVKEALKLLRASIPSTIEIRQRIDASNDTVLADPTQIHQIIMNLCTNAFHAMQESGGVLTISLRTVELDERLLAEHLQLRSGPYLVLEVSDTGPGMDTKTLERAFEPYFTTKEKGKGTGLGLAVVHGIVKSYGGHISAHSIQGQGAIFRVYLPCIVPVKGNAVVAKAAAYERGSEKILVLDDEESIIKMERRFLEGLGYQVTAMTSAKEALQMIEEGGQQFDLIITDMTMPVMTGMEFSQRVRAIAPGMGIILCTGFSALIDKEKAKAIGIDEYLMKPVLSRDLASTVRRVLDEKGQRA